jgi:hypothetical protein
LILHRARTITNDLLAGMDLTAHLALATPFLLGFDLAGGHIGGRVLLAFWIVQVLILGGASAYDRSAAFSVVMQIAGLVLAVTLGIDFWAITAALVVLSTGASHPMVRWKARPAGSLLVCVIGRGILAFDLGVLASGTRARYLQTHDLILSVILATALTAGICLLELAHRVDDDRQRGDRTLAVAHGAAGCVRGGIAVLGVAWVLTVILFLRDFSIWQGIVAGVLFGGVWARLAVRPPRRLAVSYGLSAAFAIYVLGRLILTRA